MGLLSTIGAASGRAFGFTRSAIAQAVDAYFNRVTLLLPGNGTNGAQNNTFLDSSSNAFTITRNGNTTQGTFSPFSQTGWSNYFTGLDFLRATASSLSNSQFTCEAWVYFTGTASNQALWDLSGGVGGYGSYVQVSSGTSVFSANFFSNNTGTSIGNITYSYSGLLNTWVHIATSFDGSSYRFFVNGNLAGTISSSTSTTATSTITIGGRADATQTSGYAWVGYISNFRYVTGAALYTSTFVPPTTPLGISSSGTTRVLTCQSNRFVDNSSSPYTLTIGNGSQSVQAFSPFAPTAAYSAATNGGSGYWDGSSDYLSVGAAADWTFLHNSTAAWTMEFWVYNTSTGSATTLIDTNNSTTGSTGVTVQKTASEFINVFITYSSAGNNIVNGTSNIALRANAWNHVFISYNQSLANTNLVFYINGAAAGTANKTANTPSSGNPANALSVGCYGAGGGQFFPGYISSLRISNTVRSVPSGVPTAPYTSDANTKLLLNATNAGITDATAKNVLETVGNAQISTTQSKWGGSSLSFDGTTDCLFEPSNVNYGYGTGDFTIEFWLRLNSTATQTIVSNLSSAAGTQPHIYYKTGTGAGIKYFTANAERIDGGALNTGQWYHIAVCRASGTTRMFIDGTQAGSSYTDANNYGASNPLGVGDYVVSGVPTGSATLNGYIDDLRISKYARYTANFTAPTAAFPLQ